MTFQLRLRNDDLITLPHPALMGIVNVSPESFYNPCRNLDEVVSTAAKMVNSGVDIIDVGGEATNPKVSLQARPNAEEEVQRVALAIEAIRARFDVLISVDTSRAEVMRASVEAGADMINDQRALQQEDALSTVAALKTPVCLMHFCENRRPGSSSLRELLNTVKQHLTLRINACLAGGITKDRIIIDPGFGQGHYGKNCEENFYLLDNLKEFIEIGYPVLSGWSRKSMISDALGGRDLENRLYGSVAADTIASYLGAHIIRGHDVYATNDAIAMVRQVVRKR